MLVDGSIVHYLFAREFENVTCDRAARKARVDYPIVFDASADMTGHSVLIPDHERPQPHQKLQGSICVCTCDDSAQAARDAGFAVIQVHGGATFPRLSNYMQSEFVKLERLDVQLRAYVDTRIGADALLDACAKSTGYPFALVDEHYNPICDVPGSAHPASNSASVEQQRIALEPETVDLFMASHNYQHMRLRRNVFTAPGSGDLLMRNIFVGEKLRGMVVSRHEGDVLSARFVRFILSYLGKFLEKLYAGIGSFGVAPTGPDHIRAALTQLLSGGSVNGSNIQALLRENGHAPKSRYAILNIERSFTFEGVEDHEYLARRFEASWPKAYCFTAEDALLMFADLDQGETLAHRDFLKEILIVARENLSKVGLSRPFANLDGIDAACAQAKAALQQGNATDPTFWFYRFDDYALMWLLEHGVSSAPAEYVMHPAVATLVQYDNAHGSDLVQTLHTFMQCRYNATKASAELYIARSTLLSRLERIVELTGIDFEDADDRLYLTVSLRYANE